MAFGGEEFLLVLPNTSAESAYLVADEIRVLWEKKLHADFAGYPSTCSAGIAIWNASDSFSPQELIEKADQALYKAKEKGRNRVE